MVLSFQVFAVLAATDAAVTEIATGVKFTVKAVGTAPDVVFLA
jgi:hypothetical protein